MQAALCLCSVNVSQLGIMLLCIRFCFNSSVSDESSHYTIIFILQGSRVGYLAQTMSQLPFHLWEMVHFLKINFQHI